MNRAALYFASGESFYVGSALLLFVIVVSPHLKKRGSLLLRNAGSWIALALMVTACPPFSWAIDAIFLATFSVWFIGSNVAMPSAIWERLRLLTAIALSLAVLTLSASELSHRRMPSITGASSDHVTVIGDSLSSGIDPHAPAWPNFFEQITGIRAKNLARPGAGVNEGPQMAGGVTPDDRVVLLEIGGNDLLSGTSSFEFERDLELLLAKLAVPGRALVMFELPLLPNRIAYGRIQRRLASKYGVWLIPKRYIAGVIGGPNATSDGLHLSQTGAHQFALLVARVLSPVLKPSPLLPNS